MKIDILDYPDKTLFYHDIKQCQGFGWRFLFPKISLGDLDIELFHIIVKTDWEDVQKDKKTQAA